MNQPDVCCCASGRSAEQGWTVVTSKVKSHLAKRTKDAPQASVISDKSGVALRCPVQADGRFRGQLRLGDRRAFLSGTSGSGAILVATWSSAALDDTSRRR